jgi:hypothetical protein
VYHGIIFEKIKGKILDLSTHKHGCRVIQTGFQMFTNEQKEEMLKELNQDSNVLECSVNFNGNHVIQKIFMHMG